MKKIFLLTLMFFSINIFAKSNASFIKDLEPMPHWQEMDKNTVEILNLILRNDLAYDAFKNNFNLRDRSKVDVVLKTRVRFDAVRYRIIGKNYNADQLLNCVVWEVTYHTPHPNDPLYIESVGSKVFKRDCSDFPEIK